MRSLITILLLLTAGCVSFPIDLAPQQARFCNEQPRHAICGEKRTASIRAVDSLDQVKRINSAVNASMVYAAEFDLTSDTNKFGSITLPNADVWQYDTPTGDCEDYALTKYQMLHDAGFAPDLLFLFKNGARFIDMWAHAVTVVEVDGVEWVLDNERDEIYRYDTLPWSLRKKRL